MKIYIIDDDLEFAEVVSELIVRLYPRQCEIQFFTNAVQAINAMDGEGPDLIFLDVLLDGPDGFTLLNEMQSYPDLAKVPVVLLTSLKLDRANLRQYGVVGVLSKTEMVPEQLNELLVKYGGDE